MKHSALGSEDGRGLLCRSGATNPAIGLVELLQGLDTADNGMDEVPVGCLLQTLQSQPCLQEQFIHWTIECCGFGNPQGGVGCRRFLQFTRQPRELEQVRVSRFRGADIPLIVAEKKVRDLAKPGLIRTRVQRQMNAYVVVQNAETTLIFDKKWT
ncbi:MAG: hypothetical protein ACLFP4_16885 [Spirochaetales bacterium]